MEQQEKFVQPTATKPSVEAIAKTAFFQQPDMIRFLLAENLALKSLLHEKGILNPEEFTTHKIRAEEMLAAKVNAHIEQWKAANPKVVRHLEEMEKHDCRNTDPNDPYSVF